MCKDYMTWNSDKLKDYILRSSAFTEEESNEIIFSNISSLNVRYGVVPKGMNLRLFLRILKQTDDWFFDLMSLPLLPTVQRSWNGDHLADWLIATGIIDKSKWEKISKNLDGKLFLDGCLQNVLTINEFDRVHTGLFSKVALISVDIWTLTRESKIARKSIGDFFGIDLAMLPSEHPSVLRQMLMPRYALGPNHFM